MHTGKFYILRSDLCLLYILRSDLCLLQMDEADNWYYSWVGTRARMKATAFEQESDADKMLAYVIGQGEKNVIKISFPEGSDQNIVS